MEKIGPETLVPLDLFTEVFPIRIDLAYLKPAPANIFGVIYRSGARLWLHESLAKVVLLASAHAFAKTGVQIVLFDGLRTTNAQQKMMESPIVKKNPHWLKGPNRLLSPPGAGGHPRGMAIDMTIERPEGTQIDMGTDFDFLAAKPDTQSNPAHREFAKMEAHVRTNRKILDDAMRHAHEALSTPLLFLPQEWWDFRLPSDVYEKYAPLSDSDLPPLMRMTDDISQSAGRRDLPEQHFKDLKKRICGDLEPYIARLKN